MPCLGHVFHLHRFKKVSEICYPPSLFGNILLYQVQDGGRSGVEIPITPDEPDVLDAVDVL